MTIATHIVEGQPTLKGAYGMAKQARAFRQAGQVTKALELEIQLGWDNRCTVCGHPIGLATSREAGAGRLCARIRDHH
jgi:hypothetical protein